MPPSKDKPNVESETANDAVEADEGEKRSSRKRGSRGHGVVKDQTAKGMAGQRKSWRGA